MLASRGARRRVLAAFVNAGAVAAEVAREDEITIVCAGKLGRIALEDAACAGYLCRALAERGATLEGPESRAAVTLAPGDAHEVRALVEGCDHGRTPVSLGAAFARDVSFCAQLEVVDQAFAV
jgi:2-phosphosulfolactate phosphatase